jgi:raffinose/stachyose/melibiose transport system permease protein
MTLTATQNVPHRRSAIFSQDQLSRWWQLGLAHAVLIGYTLIALFPVLLVIINSFKERRAIFGSPYTLPTPETWSLEGYETVFDNSNFGQYFLNSFIVTVGALLVIMIAGTLASFALSEYRFRGNTLLGLYFALGIMVPIRLGTVGILRIAVTLGIVDTLTVLILVYTAAGLPLAIFVMTQFMRQVPRDLKDAARVDGASEYHVYWLILPLVRPALGTVAVFNMIPIWNDLWFPLILAPSENVKTVTLGAQVFLGQFANDWNALLAALTLAIVPVILLYIIFSRQLIRGLTSGAVK